MHRRWNVRLAALLSFALLATGLTGCAGGEPKGKRGISSYGVRSNSNFSGTEGRNEDSAGRLYGSQQTSGPIVHSNNRLVYSQALSDKAASVSGVATANVVLTERNAYAAILLDNTATGTKGGGSRKETNNSGTSLGRYHAHSFDTSQDPRMLTSGSNSYETVQHADDLSHAFKQEIAAALRRARPEIHEVYISANRDFVNLMNRYAQESWSGKPLIGHIDEFNMAANTYFGQPDRHIRDK